MVEKNNLSENNDSLKIKIASLELKNPILAASGTFGYGQEYKQLFDIGILGGIVTKTITLEPKEGNFSPRIAETPCGILNSIGLQNKGVEDFIKNKLPLLKDLNTAIIVSIAGNDSDEFREITERLENTEGIDAFEINLSCPNIVYELSADLEEDKFLIAQDVYLTFAMVRAVRKVTKKPLIPKLSPNVTDIVSIAQSCYDAGADALCIANTHLGMAVDIKDRKPKLYSITGGLSGPAIKPLTLRLVWEVYQEIDLPLIASGGIMDWEDAIEFVVTGAKAVAIGTSTIVNPNAACEIIAGIKKYLDKNNIDSIESLVGSINL